MNILMTGGSSFTGFWFAKTLVQKGHAVTLSFTRSKESYTGLRAGRIHQLCELPLVSPEWNCSFGTDYFNELLTRKFDVICHHGAFVENYRSPDFNVNYALAENAKNCDQFILKAREAGIQKIVLTGSVFEANEGKGSDPLVAFSPYGLSKTFTWESFRFWAWKYNLPLVKFVVPNPFGPYEEPRFCNYLVQSWLQGKTPAVRTPDYIRDNIHVDLLAGCYGIAVENKDSGISSMNPSGYTGTQKDFTLKFAAEIGSRLNIKTDVDFPIQQEFDEPLVRTNLAPAPDYYKEWNEKEAWDQLAKYYEALLRGKK